MKVTGIVRRIRDLGRIVIPSEMRDNLQLKLDDQIQFYQDGEKIVMEKYVPGCIFCGRTENLVMFKDKKICSSCIDRLQK